MFDKTADYVRTQKKKLTNDLMNTINTDFHIRWLKSTASRFPKATKNSLGNMPT